jgi:protein required for attachment to host cells
MKPTVTWIVVADGARARAFENRGPGKGLVPISGFNLDEPHLRDRDIEADKPGRAYSSVGYGRSAMEPPTDPSDYREAIFARKLAGMLRARFENGAFDRLILAADPTALGNLREALNAELDKTIMAELPKDLTKVPLNDLPKHFDGMLAI